ncbi:hypothetical protein H072_3040 [Dactylellina haptotyla CBS 200.50]|uniref:tRNA (guanine(37)-N1)-methyltransferase n=1 Tax=Dactylellina haptotyla (strain CBS 200.50) TaxID=1284197 RepID=S8AIY9_DACHA|nr:hypothetical protein H072_3040 [Dactylellina haptotyla CBS 200.50]
MTVTSSQDTPVQNPIEHKGAAQEEEEDMLSGILRAPGAAGMKVLNREVFTKRIPTMACLVKSNKDIEIARKAAGSTILRDRLERTFINVKTLYGEDGKKTYTIPLWPSVQPTDESTIPPKLLDLVKEQRVELREKEGILTYADFTTEEILKSILPHDQSDGVHQSFTHTGHIAHINLDDEYLEYKDVIAQVILDKNPSVETVVHKIDEVGATSEFRTFPMEILAGREGTDVVVRHSGCTYAFDFAKVYWNSRLENEHDRIANLCKPGEAVCDVMAGVGPFAIPAARFKRALVWANDLNEESYNSMVTNVKANKVQGLVYPFNADGREFIRLASKTLFREAGREIRFDPNPPNAPRDPKINTKLKPIEIYKTPGVFKRFIMNLPATAVEFLDAFIGLYTGLELHFDNPSRPDGLPGEAEKHKLPIIHVYTFNKLGNRPADVPKAAEEVVEQISQYLQYPMTVERTSNLREAYTVNMKTKAKQPFRLKKTEADLAEGERIAQLASGEDMFIEGGVRVGFVRAVAPNKSMYCATFRLPREVAFRQPITKLSDEEKKFEKMKSVWLRSAEEQAWPGKLKQ